MSRDLPCDERNSGNLQLVVCWRPARSCDPARSQRLSHISDSGARQSFHNNRFLPHRSSRLQPLARRAQSRASHSQAVAHHRLCPRPARPRSSPSLYYALAGRHPRSASLHGHRRVAPRRPHQRCRDAPGAPGLAETSHRSRSSGSPVSSIRRQASRLPRPCHA